MKTKNNTLRTRTLGVLASILAAGAIAPSPQSQTSPGGQSQAAQRGAPTTITRAAPGAQREALPPPTAQSGGQVLGVIGGTGGGGYVMTSRAGMDPKTWGMSSWCKKMRLKNVRIGAQPHYRPRARA